MKGKLTNASRRILLTPSYWVVESNFCDDSNTTMRPYDLLLFEDLWAKRELKDTKSTALVARYKVVITSLSYLYRLFPTFSKRQQSP